MKGLISGLMVSVLFTAAASAGMVTDKIAYQFGGKSFEGILVYDDAVKAKRPAVLMAPNWMGINRNAVTKARMLAGGKYVIFIADMYTKGVRPKNSKQARKAAGSVRKDIEVQRGRINKALDVLLAEGARRGLIADGKTAAIGFCFGGGNVLELARSGRAIKAVVTFHGSLKAAEPKDAANIKAKLLVLHGADDPGVPKAHRDALEAELSAAKVDYQIVAFGNTVHSFTNPKANRPGRSMYNATSARRAYAMMNNLFDEVF